MGQRDWQRLMDKNPAPSAPNDPSSSGPDRPSGTSNPDTAKPLSQLAQEGGVNFIQYLLAKAIPHDDTLPQPSQVREWQFRDISKFPREHQEEWKTACCKELE